MSTNGQAIDQGEVATLSARFKSAPPEPVRVWVLKRSQVKEGPFTMSQSPGDPLLYEYQYPTTESGTHVYGVETAPPVAAAESTFIVVPRRARGV